MQAPSRIVTNQERNHLDIVFGAPTIITELSGRPLVEHADVVITAYYEPRPDFPLQASGLVLFDNTLYRCERNAHEEAWRRTERVRDWIVGLQRETTRKLDFQQSAHALHAYHVAAMELTVQLALSWYVLAGRTITPGQRKLGTLQVNHVILKESWKDGRFSRQCDDALCLPREKFNGTLTHEVQWPTCKSCLLRAERLVRKRVEALLKESFSLDEPSRQMVQMARELKRLRERWGNLQLEGLLLLRDVQEQDGALAERLGRALCAEREWARKNFVEQRNALIDALMWLGTELGFPELVTELCEVEAGIDEWCVFVERASLEALQEAREMAGYKYQALQGRKKLVQLSLQVSR